LFVLLAVLVSIAVAGSLGGPLGPRDALAIVVQRLVYAGWAPAVYVLAAFGLGRIGRPLWRDRAGALALQAAVGLGLMLTFSHSLLCFYGTGGLARAFSFPVFALGVMLAFDQARAAFKRRRSSQSSADEGIAGPLEEVVVLLVIASGVGILFAAACSPPGWLWDTEFGGYDALEYHLQLPQEWLARGRIEPLTHNVYSFLPGYVEAAYTHVALLMGLPASPGADGRMGLLAGDGMGAISCQILHALITIIAAWVCGACARVAAERCELEVRACAWSGRIVGLLVLVTPWTIVTGSLAYNEMALLALSAGAMLAALCGNLSVGVRGAICGFLVGAACGAKPTAIVFTGVPVGLVLAQQAMRVGRGAVLKAVLSGAIVGSLSLLPWLVRNWMASHNPVFPVLAHTFSSAHWSWEQVERYGRVHSFSGTLLERLRLMVMPDPNDPAGARHRGFLHPQWGVFFIITSLALADVLFWLRKRPVVWMLAIGFIAQVGLWLFATHLQSRFLVPLVVTGGCIVGLAAASAITRYRAQRFRLGARVALVLVVAAQAGWLWHLFASQRGGKPMAFLDFVPAGFAGQIPDGTTEDTKREMMESNPRAYLATTPERVWLLGDSKAFYYPPGTRYSTTYDSSPVIEWIATRGPIPSELLGASILVDLNELSRLERSGLLDPRLTMVKIREWMDRHTRVIKQWPQLGIVLVKPMEQPDQ